MMVAVICIVRNDVHVFLYGFVCHQRHFYMQGAKEWRFAYPVFFCHIWMSTHAGPLVGRTKGVMEG